MDSSAGRIMDAYNTRCAPTVADCPVGCLGSRLQVEGKDGEIDKRLASSARHFERYRSGQHIDLWEASRNIQQLPFPTECRYSWAV